MRVTREVPIGDRTVVVHELTVGEIRAWLKDQETLQQIDLVDGSLFADFSVPDLYRLSNLTQDTADQFTPGELAEVAEKAREVNPAFFQMRGRIAALGQQLAMTLKPPSPG